MGLQMSNRITKEDLNGVVAMLNRDMGYDVDLSQGRFPEGTFIVQGAYGGWQLQRVLRGARGVVSYTCGYQTKRFVYDSIQMIRAGIALANEKNFSGSNS